MLHLIRPRTESKVASALQRDQVDPMDSIVPNLPSEVWQLILDHFPKKTSLRVLQALCLTSEGFRAIAQPKLFETLHLFTLPLPNAEHERAAGILDLFSSRPESQNWTSDLTIYGIGAEETLRDASNTPGEHDGSPQKDAIIRSVFLQMQGLQRLELFHFTLTSEMFNYLYNLHRLRTLWISGISTSEMTERDRTSKGTLRLKNLKITEYPRDYGPAAMKIYQPLLCSTLQTLTLDPKNADAFLDHFPSHPSFVLPSLRSFDILPSLDTLPNPRALFNFLRSCPALSRLVLPAYSPPLHSLTPGNDAELQNQSDGGTCAQHLESILAPASLAHLLLPGRPLNDLEAIWHRESPLLLSASALRPYTFGSVPLKKLVLGPAIWTNDSMQTLAKLFLKLELLCLRLVSTPISDWYNNDLGRRIALFKHLDSFTLIPLYHAVELWTGAEAAAKERKFLAEAEGQGSCITTMVLGPHDAWTKRKDGVWESRYEKDQESLKSWMVS